MEGSSASPRLLAVGLVLGVTLVAFETTAVITALPTITAELGGDSLYGLTLAAYTLANLVALVVSGEIADRRGPALPYLLSVITFIGGLIVAATAPTMPIVVLGRVLQGAGTGGFAPIAYMLVKRAFPATRQARMYVLLSAGWVLPSLLAPALAGAVTERFGWRWVFLGIIPFAVALAALAVRPMRAFGPVGEQRVEPSRIPLALRAAAGVGAVVTGLQFANPLAAVATAGAGVVVGVPALRALLPAGVGRARSGIAAVVACRVLATATFLGVDSFVPLAAARIHGASPTTQGFVIIGAALTWTGGSWLIVHRPASSPAIATRFGFAGLLGGIALVAPVLASGWPLWATFLGWAVGGLGMGVLFNPTTEAAMSYAELGREGRLSSQVNLADSLGFSLMGGLGGAMVALADRTSLTIRGALGTNFAIAAALACVGLVACRGIRQRSTVAGTAGTADAATQTAASPTTTPSTSSTRRV